LDKYYAGKNYKCLSQTEIDKKYASLVAAPIFQIGSLVKSVDVDNYTEPFQKVDVYG